MKVLNRFGQLAFTLLPLLAFAETEELPGEIENPSAPLIDTAPTQEAALGMEPQPESCTPACCSTVSPFYGELSHRTRKGVGFDDGYSSVRLFLSPTDYCNWLPFFDGRIHFMCSTRTAANAGVGMRKRLECTPGVWGANLYYDYRRTYGRDVQQVGLGTEFLTKCWKLRANAYWPFSNTRRKRSLTFERFFGNDIIVKRKDDVAMWGLDLDFEGRLYTCGDKYIIDGGIIPYYYRTRHYSKSTAGAKARLNFTLCKYLYLRAEYSYDRIFESRLNGEFGLRIPFGGKQTGKYQRPKSNFSFPVNCCCDADVMALMVSRPHRQEIIATTTRTKSGSAHYSDGPLIYVVHVDNIAAAGGTGTFESPLDTLADAEVTADARDVIYVNLGDGLTTNMDAGIALQIGQKLFGSGTAHPIDTNCGPFTLPAQTLFNPTITHTAGSGVTLANGVEVAGFNIPGASINGIFGLNLTVAPLVRNINISMTNQSGFSLIWSAPGDVAGTFIIKDSVFVMNGGNGLVASYVPGSANILNMSITNNLFSTNGADGSLILSDQLGITNLDLDNNISINNTLPDFNFQANNGGVLNINSFSGNNAAATFTCIPGTGTINGSPCP